MQHELLWAGGLLAAMIVTAALVNRFNVEHRSRVRRIAILFIVLVVTLGVHSLLTTLGETVWAPRFLVAVHLLEAFTVINITAAIVFSVALPRTGLTLPMIASDLIVGFGYLLATIGVLSGHGLNPTSALATGAVVSAVLAISLQSTLGNILGGVALQLDGSVHEGDWIQLENGKQGRVRSIRWRHTVVETRDWSTIIVPNAQLLANNITILGKRESKAVPFRMWVWFNVDFRFPPTRVIQVVSEALVGATIEGVAANPPPNCVCMDFTRDHRESFATYAVRYWLTDLAADDPTSSRVRARIYTALRRAGIPLAIPATTAWVQLENDERARAKRERRANERLDALKQIALFRTFNSDELTTLAEGLSHVIYCAGETITRQGAVAHFLYILVQGRAEIRTTIDPDGDGPLPPQTRKVSELHAPDVFGEMGLMTGEPRLADVVATTDVECFRLDKEAFERVLLARPEIATELSGKLAERKVALLAARDEIDDASAQQRVTMERDRILGAIKSFFHL